MFGFCAKISLSICCNKFQLTNGHSWERTIPKHMHSFSPLYDIIVHGDIFNHQIPVNFTYKTVNDVLYGNWLMSYLQQRSLKILV